MIIFYIFDTEKASLCIIILMTHRNVPSLNAIRRTRLTFAKANIVNVKYAFLFG